MSVEVTTRWQKVEVLRTARRRRALAELDYRRALIEVVESGLEVSEVAQRLQVSEATLQGMWERCEGISEAAEGFSGSSPREILQRYEVGLLTDEEVVRELSEWDYDGRREAQTLPPVVGHRDAGADGGADGGADVDAHGDADGVGDGGVGVGAGTGSALTAPGEGAGGGGPGMGEAAGAQEPPWSMWLSEGSWESAQAESGQSLERAALPVGDWASRAGGMSVDPDGEWAQVEDAYEAGLLPEELYGRVLVAVNPGMVSGHVSAQSRVADGGVDGVERGDLGGDEGQDW